MKKWAKPFISQSESDKFVHFFKKRNTADDEVDRVELVDYQV